MQLIWILTKGYAMNEKEAEAQRHAQELHDECCTFGCTLPLSEPWLMWGQAIANREVTYDDAKSILTKVFA